MKKLITWFEDEPSRILYSVAAAFLLALGLCVLGWAVILRW